MGKGVDECDMGTVLVSHGQYSPLTSGLSIHFKK